MPKRGVDDDVGILRQAPNRLQFGHRVEHAPVRGKGIAPDSRHLSDQGHRGGEALPRREPCDHESVAAVVAGAGDHRHAARRRPSLAQRPEGFEPGALHQVDSGYARRLDRVAVEFAHVEGPVQRGRKHDEFEAQRRRRSQSSRSNSSR